MPLIARGAQVDIIECIGHGTGLGCSQPLFIGTLECSPNVFVAGVGVVRQGDKMTAHPTPTLLCQPHSPPLVTTSLNVYANNKLIGRLGDEYIGGDDHTIRTVTQSSVYANG